MPNTGIMESVCGHTDSMSAENKKTIIHFLKLAGITIVVYMLMRYIFPIVVPFLAAFLIAMVLHPIVERVSRRIKIKKRILAAVILLLAVVIVMAAVLAVSYKLLVETGNLITHYPQIEARVISIWNQCCKRFEEVSGCPTGVIQEYARNCLDNCSTGIQEKMIPCVMGWSISGMRGAFAFIGKALVTVISALLILMDYDKLSESAGSSQAGRWFCRLGGGVKQAGGMYIRAQLIIIGMVMVTCVIGLFLTGNSYALVAGLLIGLCDALPFLGTGTVFIPWIILTVFRGKYALSAAYAAIYIICSIIREYVEPKIVGKGLGVHPLAVIIAIYVGICLFQAWGIILGPLSALLISHTYNQLTEEETISP